MRNKKITALMLVAILGWGAGSAFGSVDLAEEDVALLLDLKTINEVLSFCAKEEDDFDYPSKWMTLRAFARRLPEPYSARLPAKDPWGGAYLIVGQGREMVVVSAGPDGVEQVRDLAEGFPEFDPIAKEMLAESDDAILVVGEDIVKAATSRATLQRETMNRMKAGARAIEKFFATTGHYPARGAELMILSNIASDLPSGRTGDLRLEDAWGNSLLYWSDSSTFMIVSTGADAVLERDYSLGARGVVAPQFLGEFTDEDSDIVHHGGQFVQWPKLHDHH